MIKFSKYSTIIYIDHDVNSVITTIIKLIIFNVDKLNMKLIKAFTYLSQFKLNVRYRSKKFNIVSNALSRLFATKDTSSQKTLNVNVDLEHFQSDMNSSENDRVSLRASNCHSSQKGLVSYRRTERRTSKY